MYKKKVKKYIEKKVSYKLVHFISLKMNSNRTKMKKKNNAILQSSLQEMRTPLSLSFFASKTI